MIQLETLQYISSAPGFWSGLGYTTASAMFIGSIIYNGEFKLAMKGVITVLSYALFLLIITSARVDSVATQGQIVNLAKAYAGIATIYITSAAYILGMIMGVLVTRYARRIQKYGKNKFDD